jgi:predicted transcriptional regulator
MVKAARVAIRMNAELKKKVERLAEADKRSLSSWIELAIAREIDRIEFGNKRKSEKK